MAARVRVTVSRDGVAWIVKFSGGVFPAYVTYTKQEAIEAAARDCRQIARKGGKAELIIKNINGQIGRGTGSRRTYPKRSDPRRSRG